MREVRSLSANVGETLTFENAVASVSLSPASASISVGASQQFTADVRDADNNVLDRSVWWSSSDDAVADIQGAHGDPWKMGDQVTVDGVGAGSATITAISEGISDDSEITVTATSTQVLTALPPPQTHVSAGARARWELLVIGAFSDISLGSQPLSTGGCRVVESEFSGRSKLGWPRTAPTRTLECESAAGVPPPR